MLKFLVIFCIAAVSRAVPTIPQLQTRLAPDVLSLDDLWGSYYKSLGGVAFSGRTVSSLLGPLLEYKYSLTPTQLRNAVVFSGYKPRLRRIVWNLLTGRKHVKIGVIGTSVSWGTGASKRGTTDWVSMLPVALKMVFPNANITVRNGCFPATGSGFANMCWSHMVDPDTSLLFMEFVTNDFVTEQFYASSHTLGLERLVRKTLSMNEQPALVLMQVPTWGQCFNQSQLGKKPFQASGEDMYGSVAQFYGLPALSYRAAFWHDVTRRTPVAPNGWIDITLPDLVHPNDRGHRAMLDMAVWLILQTALDVLMRPLSSADSQALQQPLPPPMHPGNWEEKDEMCLLEESLQKAALQEESKGWAFVNEGTTEKRKFGWVSTTPGTSLVIRVNISALLGAQKDTSSSAGPRKLGLTMGYLQSYTNMGRVAVACQQGCVCEPREFDAHHSQRTSTTFVALIPVEAVGSECKVAVTVLQATSSGGHKFKVSAVMVNRMEAMGFNWPTNKAAEWNLHDMLSGAWGATQIDV